MKKLSFLSIVLAGFMLIFAGCSQRQNSENGMENDTTMSESGRMQAENGTHNAMNKDEDRNMAIATIRPTKGNKVEGNITFNKSDDGIKVHADVSGLPAGKHGFHVHLYGDCSADDGTSAGTHYNFEGSSKNPPSDIDRITGNLGEIDAQGSGSATADTTISNTSLDDILGRAVIIHAKGNDPSQPPIGAAGARLGCGVIGHANPESVMTDKKMNKMGQDNMQQ